MSLLLKQIERGAEEMAQRLGSLATPTEAQRAVLTITSNSSSMGSDALCLLSTSEGTHMCVHIYT